MALAGAARVTNGAGLLLASIPAGRGMSFSQQAGATGSVTRTGCLLYKDGHYILQDENTQEVVELNARDAMLSDLKNNTGNRVEVSGTAGATKPAVSIATLLVNVAAITVKSQGGCLSAAAARRRPRGKLLRSAPALAEAAGECRPGPRSRSLRRSQAAEPARRLRSPGTRVRPAPKARSRTKAETTDRATIIMKSAFISIPGPALCNPRVRRKE